MHTPLIATLKLCPIASFNGALAELGQSWRIEPVVAWEGAFVLSTAGAIQPEQLADLADDLGLYDLSELDDYLSPREPWATLGGFVLKDSGRAAATEVAVWAADKLGLTGLLPAGIAAGCR